MFDSAQSRPQVQPAQYLSGSRPFPLGHHASGPATRRRIRACAIQGASIEAPNPKASVVLTLHSLQRNIPARGFRPVWYVAAVGVLVTFGMYKVGQGNREQV